MILKVDSYACFADKFGEYAFFTSNLMPRKELKPSLIIFKNLPIFSLSATLNAIGTSVPGGHVPPQSFTKYRSKSGKVIAHG